MAGFEFYEKLLKELNSFTERLEETVKDKEKKRREWGVDSVSILKDDGSAVLNEEGAFPPLSKSLGKLTLKDVLANRHNPAGARGYAAAGTKSYASAANSAPTAGLTQAAQELPPAGSPASVVGPAAAAAAAAVPPYEMGSRNFPPGYQELLNGASNVPSNSALNYQPAAAGPAQPGPGSQMGLPYQIGGASSAFSPVVPGAQQATWNQQPNPATLPQQQSYGQYGSPHPLQDPSSAATGQHSNYPPQFQYTGHAPSHPQAFPRQQQPQMVNSQQGYPQPQLVSGQPVYPQQQQQPQMFSGQQPYSPQAHSQQQPQHSLHYGGGGYDHPTGQQQGNNKPTKPPTNLLD